MHWSTVEREVKFASRSHGQARMLSSSSRMKAKEFRKKIALICLSRFTGVILREAEKAVELAWGLPSVKLSASASTVRLRLPIERLAAPSSRSCFRADLWPHIQLRLRLSRETWNAGFLPSSPWSSPMRSYHGLIAATVLSLTGIAASQTYHVAAHWPVGGQGGWDYLLSDDAAHRLYVTHNSRV